MAPGRHRVLARVISDGSSVRLLTPDGRAADVVTDADDLLGYTSTPPKVIGNPNAIDAIVTARAASDVASPKPSFDQVLAGFIAHIEGMDDVASVLMEPLVTPKNA